MVDHWESHARQWAHIGPPLRPTTSDIAFVEHVLSHVAGSPFVNAALLGATPELAGMRWPAHTVLVGIDRNPAMLQHVWPSEKSVVPSYRIQGEWSSLSLKQGSMNAVVGDGCFTLLVGEQAYRSVSIEVQRILKPGGQFVMRFFTRPEKQESPGVVFDDLYKGLVGNFHVFKWRLAMSLQQSLETGVAVAEIWEAWRDAKIDPAVLAYDRGWSVESIDTIQVYKDSNARYSFPTWSEVQSLLGEFFEERAHHVGNYELGERCPTVAYVLRT